jgi:hypothetical protein
MDSALRAAYDEPFVIFGIPPAAWQANNAHPGALAINPQTGAIWRNIGTLAAPVWALSPILGAFAHYQSGLYYGTQSGSTTTSAPANNNMRTSPFVVNRTIRIDRLAIEVTNNGSADAAYRLGIYADDGNGRANALVLDAGTVTGLDSTGAKTITVDQALAPGLYWLAAVCQGATTPPTVRAITNPYPQVGASSGAGVFAPAGWQRASGISGALPNPITSGGAIDTGITTAPKVSVRIV